MLVLLGLLALPLPSLAESQVPVLPRAVDFGDTKLYVSFAHSDEIYVFKYGMQILSFDVDELAADRNLGLDPEETSSIRRPLSGGFRSAELARRTGDDKLICFASDSDRGGAVVLGMFFSLQLFASTGEPLWQIRTPAQVLAVNFPGSKDVVVAALGDGTLRWYRARDGQLLVSVFLAERDGRQSLRRWFAWTSSGYWASSPGDEDLFLALVSANPADQERLHQPDVFSLILSFRDEARAVDPPPVLIGKNVIVHRQEVARAATSELAIVPPVLTLLTPSPETEAREPVLEVKLAVRSPSGEPVTQVRAYVDGQPAALARGVSFEPDPPPADPQGERIYTLSVPVPPRDSTVTLVAETRLANSAPLPVKVRWAAVPVPARPNVYLLAVGVSRYDNPAFRLELPAKDAQDVAAAWKAQEGQLYEKVETKVLVDPTKDEVEDGLEWLERRTTQNDVAVVFFAGHGINDPRSGDYLFLPKDADLDARRKTLLSQRDLQSVFTSIPGKVIFFLDTCHSGNLLGGKERGLAGTEHLLAELKDAGSGAVVFSATTGAGKAQEDASLGNGAFTKALVEALQGRADGDGDGSVWVTELDAYLGRRVRDLTGGTQIPTSAKPRNISDFPLAVVGKGGGR